METEEMKRIGTRRNWRRIGWVLLAAGLALLPALSAYGNARFPLTDYNSTIDVEYRTVYYAHELRAGDMLVFALRVTGPPVDLIILDPHSYAALEEYGEVPVGTTPEAFVPGLAGSVEVPFRVRETGVHYVVFRSACDEDCPPTSLRARVYQNFGSLAGVPLSLAYAGAGLAAPIGFALLVRSRPHSQSS